MGCTELLDVSMRCSGLERGADVAAVDRVGEIEAARGTDLAEVLLDLVERERRVVAVGRVQELDQLGDAPGVVAEVRGDLLARRRARASGARRAARAAARRRSARRGADDLGVRPWPPCRARSAPARRPRRARGARRRAGRRSTREPLAPVRSSRCRCRARPRPGPTVMNGGLCSAVVERGERRQLGRTFGRTASSSSSPASASPARALGSRTCGRRARTNDPRPRAARRRAVAPRGRGTTGRHPGRSSMLTAAPRSCGRHAPCPARRARARSGSRASRRTRPRRATPPGGRRSRARAARR